MAFTAKQLKKIRSILPKNYRELIVQKCSENGVQLTVRQVSRILSNESKQIAEVDAVAEALSSLIREQKAGKKMAEQKINAELE